MSFKILEKKGNEIRGIDGACMNYIISGKQEGVLAGRYNEFSITSETQDNYLHISPGHLFASGYNVISEEEVTLDIPNNETKIYALIGQISLSLGQPSFSFILSDIPYSLTKDSLFTSDTETKTYQIYIGRFKNNSGKVTDVMMSRTIPFRMPQWFFGAENEFPNEAIPGDCFLVTATGAVYKCSQSSNGSNSWTLQGTITQGSTGLTMKVYEIPWVLGTKEYTVSESSYNEFYTNAINNVIADPQRAASYKIMVDFSDATNYKITKRLLTPYSVFQKLSLTAGEENAEIIYQDKDYRMTITARVGDATVTTNSFKVKCEKISIVANNGEDATTVLNTLLLEGTNYRIPSGSGGGYKKKINISTDNLYTDYTDEIASTMLSELDENDYSNLYDYIVQLGSMITYSDGKTCLVRRVLPLYSVRGKSYTTSSGGGQQPPRVSFLDLEAGRVYFITRSSTSTSTVRVGYVDAPTLDDGDGLSYGN